jgi:hypothetical protein
MRKLLFSVVVLLFTGTPASVQAQGQIALSIIMGPVQYFAVNNAGPLAFTFNEYSDFGVAQDIGDVNYDLTSNTGWEVKGQIRDDTSGGQTPDDWDDGNWTLSVNGVAITESIETVIDTDPNPVNRTGALWEVLLTIPWPENPSNPDCAILLTATEL